MFGNNVKITNLLAIITPLNLEIEKEKFLLDKDYSPQLQYIWQNPDIKIGSPTIIKRRLYSAIKNQDISKIQEYSSIFFECEIENQALNLAKEIVENKIEFVNSDNIDTLVNKFNIALDYFNLKYKIKLIDTSAYNIRPSLSKKTIFISKNTDFKFIPADGAVMHEMVHIIRAENDFYNKQKRLSRKHIATDEGLACFFQDFHTRGGQYSYFHHAAEYLASSISKDHDFKTVYNFFINLNYSESNAWKRAIRHKFGFVDTSKGGDILKPAMYFYTEQKIKDLSNNDKLKLLSGKHSYKHLERIGEYSGEIPLEKVKHYFFDNNI